MLYSLFIFKTDQGTFNGYFPDIEKCVFSGDTLEDAVFNAREAFTRHARILVAKEGVLSAPKPPVDYLDNISITQNNGYLTFIEIDPSKYETKAIKFDLVMSGSLLNAMDKYIETNGQYKSRSVFLSELVRKEITKE